jgi:16S rRNA (guanine527-N7)-methyltransferase
MTASSSHLKPLALLQEGARALGLRLPSQTLEQFRIYLEELQRWNARVNLTGLKTDQDIVVKHFLDSLAVLPYLGEAASLADLGSGPGFPGLALKLVWPSLNLFLVEARAKKAAFLQYLARQWGPRFDAVTSRAAFPLLRFLELAAPLLLPGGRVLALKGPNLPSPELDAARKRCLSLGLGSLELHHYLLPLTGEERLLVSARRV